MSDSEDRATILSRDQQVRDLEPGASISIADRVDMSFGLDADGISVRTRQLRGIIDQSANRARKAIRDSEYIVENGMFVTKQGALVISAVVTRLK